MNYTLDYLLEYFPVAARHLATAEGDVKARVELAWGYIRHFQSDRLPETLRRDFVWIESKLTKGLTKGRKKLGDFVARDGTIREETLIAANLRAVRIKDRAEIADRIYTMYQKVLGMACKARPGGYLRFPK